MQMDDSITKQIDSILIQIKAKHMALKQIRQKRTKQRGMYQFQLEHSERIELLSAAEQKMNEEISHSIEALNAELSKLGKETINNPFKKG